ncbi:MAG: Outer membrane TonB-dependent transporter, utilization system for glycans and polysaccharides (PUL), SusC family, partial [uncultured Gemmatimonadaceae bacterium]
GQTACPMGARARTERGGARRPRRPNHRLGARARHRCGLGRAGLRGTGRRRGRVGGRDHGRRRAVHDRPGAHGGAHDRRAPHRLHAGPAAGDGRGGPARHRRLRAPHRRRGARPGGGHRHRRPHVAPGARHERRVGRQLGAPQHAGGRGRPGAAGQGGRRADRAELRQPGRRRHLRPPPRDQLLHLGLRPALRRRRRDRRQQLGPAPRPRRAQQRAEPARRPQPGRHRAHRGDPRRRGGRALRLAREQRRGADLHPPRPRRPPAPRLPDALLRQPAPRAAPAQRLPVQRGGRLGGPLRLPGRAVPVGERLREQPEHRRRHRADPVLRGRLVDGRGGDPPRHRRLAPHGAREPHPAGVPDAPPRGGRQLHEQPREPPAERRGERRAHRLHLRPDDGQPLPGQRRLPHGDRGEPAPRGGPLPLPAGDRPLHREPARPLGPARQPQRRLHLRLRRLHDAGRRVRAARLLPGRADRHRALGQRDPRLAPHRPERGGDLHGAPARRHRARELGGAQPHVAGDRDHHRRGVQPGADRRAGERGRDPGRLAEPHRAAHARRLRPADGRLRQPALPHRRASRGRLVDLRRGRAVAALPQGVGVVRGVGRRVVPQQRRGGRLLLAPPARGARLRRQPAVGAQRLLALRRVQLRELRREARAREQRDARQPGPPAGAAARGRGGHRRRAVRRPRLARGDLLRQARVGAALLPPGGAEHRLHAAVLRHRLDVEQGARAARAHGERRRLAPALGDHAHLHAQPQPRGGAHDPRLHVGVGLPQPHPGGGAGRDLLRRLHGAQLPDRRGAHRLAGPAAAVEQPAGQPRHPRGALGRHLQQREPAEARRPEPQLARLRPQRVPRRAERAAARALRRQLRQRRDEPHAPHPGPELGAQQPGGGARAAALRRRAQAPAGVPVLEVQHLRAVRRGRQLREAARARALVHDQRAAAAPRAAAGRRPHARRPQPVRLDRLHRLRPGGQLPRPEPGGEQRHRGRPRLRLRLVPDPAHLVAQRPVHLL